VSGPEADRPAVWSAQAWWWARLPAAWPVDRCAAECPPEECRLGAVHAPYARAEAYRRAACLQAVSSSEQQSAALASWDARVPQAAAEVGAACESVRQPAASVLSALRVGEAVAEPLAPRPAGAQRVEAAGAQRVAAGAVEAVVPHAEVAREVAPHVAGAQQGEAARAVLRQAAVVLPAVPEPRAAARPSAAAPSSPSRLRSAPARRSAVTRCFARAPRRLQTASL
jgi:hypothetical protein